MVDNLPYSMTNNNQNSILAMQGGLEFHSVPEILHQGEHEPLPSRTSYFTMAAIQIKGTARSVFPWKTMYTVWFVVYG